MAAYASGRSGLAVRVQPGDRGGSDDINQLADALLAGKRILVDLLGGEAIYAGGAAVLADLTGGGRNYPAVTLIIADDSGNPWPFKTASVTAITFNVTSTAAGAARLYAVPVTMAGVSPAAADGRYSQVRFVADDVANAAPAHSLLLGSGTIAASAFTAFTPAGTAPAESLIADASTTVRGKVKLATSSQTTAGLAVQASDPRLADRRDPNAHASSHRHAGTDEVATATPAANAVPKADASGRLDAWLSDASTSAKGKVQLAADGGTNAGTAVQASDARLADKRDPNAHASSHRHAGTDEVATAAPAANAIPKADASGRLDAWVSDASTSAKGKVQLAADGGATAGTAVQASDARLNNDRVIGPASSTSGNLPSFNGAGGKTLQDSGVAASDVARLGTAQAFTARCTFTNGLRATVRDAKFGPPISGTYVAGDGWIDRAGAMWYCTTGGTPGAWEQITLGVTTVWSGAGDGDVTATGQWNGGTILNGYRIFEPAYGGIWTYNTGLSSARWVGRQYAIAMAPTAAAFSATTTAGYVALSDDYDYQLVEYSAVWSGAAGTWDGSNYWQVQLRKGSLTLGAFSNWSDLISIPAAGMNGGRAAPASGAAIHVTATHGMLYFGLVKTGTTAGNLTLFGGTALVRELRK